MLWRRIDINYVKIRGCKRQISGTNGKNNLRWYKSELVQITINVQNSPAKRNIDR